MLNPAIGLLGGTFNPIHWGHLLPTKTVMEQLNLAQIKLIPAHRPPHKQTPGVDSEKRAAMVELACKQMYRQYHCQFQVDLLELNRNEPSYTLETLKLLQQQYPHNPLCFLMGLDSLVNFHTWHQYQQILERCHLVVSCRPGYQIDQQSQAAKLLKQRQTKEPKDISKQKAGLIYMANIEPIEVSSSEIRQRINQGLAVDHLLPSDVLQYIKQFNLYQ